MLQVIRRFRHLGLHAYRWGVLALIVVLIRQQHVTYQVRQHALRPTAITLDAVRKYFPEASRLADWRPGQEGQTVEDAGGAALGFVIQTAPDSDAVIGYSGPTNLLLAFDKSQRILGIEVLSCGDTPEHLQAVLAKPSFFQSFVGLTWEEARRPRTIDGVSGATLTSLAMAEGLQRRLGGTPHSYRFPEPLNLDDARRFFPQAARVAARADRPGLQTVLDGGGQRLGTLARTSPVADDMIGFQGPTDTLLALDAQDRVLGIALRKSYETESFLGYITDDRRFLKAFNGKTLAELSALDLQAAGVEGVSGATMTSLVMARGLVATAEKLRQPPPSSAAAPRPWLAPRDLSTILLVGGGLLLAFTRLRGVRVLRTAFQILLVVWLGLINSDLLSQTLLVGWAQNGPAWRWAPGLLVLAGVAFLVPGVSRRQVYCHQLCPHGAAQQLLLKVGRWRVHLPRGLAHLLRLLPAGLLLWTVVVAGLHWPFNLAALEPFDAYAFRVAGWATLTVAGLGLAVSWVLPMAYCRFGCPTGALLNFLRYRGHSDRFGARDYLAACFLGLALVLRYWGRL